MSVPFNDPLNEYYDLYSVRNENVSIPDHFLAYAPDHNDDFSCISVLTPNLEAGAKRWTIYGRWITIGVYRDEGREPVEGTNFYETRCVFRLLPSFKLVPYSLIQEIFEASAPNDQLSLRTLHDLTSGTDTKVPSGRSSSTNYDVPRVLATNSGLTLPRRFDQNYDENGNPLKLSYYPTGNPAELHPVDSPFKNEKVLTQTPADRMVSDAVPRVFDFYGLEVNDASRGPHFANDLVTRDGSSQSVRGNIKRKKRNPSDKDPIYTGRLFDRFGNIALGIQENNALLSRVPILPLELDNFNRPIKAPMRRLT